MPRAVWNGAVLAESNDTKKVEGNHYFPADSINRQYFKKSSTKTVCPWKGTASYYDIEVDGKVNSNAAWYYPSPSKAAAGIKGHIAFWGGVKVERSDDESSDGILTAIKRLVGG